MRHLIFGLALCLAIGTLTDPAAAKLHLRDDYPGECYPADMLWAVAAIQRAARLDGTHHDALAESLMETYDGPLKAAEGLPAFQADSRSGYIIQGARGCGNSGILLFASELDPEIAGRWYNAYDKNFWKDTPWCVGFTEKPLQSQDDFMDVDSGPVIFGIGSVALAFGIGASKTVGRIDRAAPLTMETVACSWPTPFGFLIPGLMGRLAAQSWSLGEVAILFSMTRPTLAAETVPFEGHAPPIVWILFCVYAGAGTFFIWFEIRSLRRLAQRHAIELRFPKWHNRLSRKKEIKLIRKLRTLIQLLCIKGPRNYERRAKQGGNTNNR